MQSLSGFPARRTGQIAGPGALNDNAQLQAGQRLIPVQVLGAPTARGQVGLKQFPALRQSAQLGQIAG